jgi:hypothetical protein
VPSIARAMIVCFDGLAVSSVVRLARVPIIPARFLLLLVVEIFFVFRIHNTI